MEGEQLEVDPQQPITLEMPAGMALGIMQLVEENLSLKQGRPIYDHLNKQILAQVAPKQDTE